MIINLVTAYLPGIVISNDYFSDNYGISGDEIVAKSGIKQRRQTLPDENANTMAIEAVKNAEGKLPYPIQDIDLIIGATYTPFDTIGTIAHAVQAHFKIENTRTFTINSACSSFLNALEVADAYFAAGKAQKALVVISENNSLYNNLSDPKSGFLWGDGAAAVFISNERYSDDDLEVLDINTRGLGNIGKNIEGVYLRPLDGGLKMPYGKDVFQQACTYMVEETEQLLAKNNLSVADINYLIPHQANIRIIDYVAKSLNISKEKVLNNIEFLGNTGSASAAIVLAQYFSTFKKDDKIVISVFGGGYSSGTALLKK